MWSLCFIIIIKLTKETRRSVGKDGIRGEGLVRLREDEIRDYSLFKPVLRIRIRIHMFLGLPDPDPLVRAMDPDPSIIMQK